MNMTPQERKAAFMSIDEPKPTWETFKRMMSMLNNDVERVMSKWIKQNKKKKQ